MKIEILHERDPDSACTLTVFVDGVQVDVTTEEDVDPGAGYERSDWNEHTRFVETEADYSPGFKAAVLQAREDASESVYITGDDEDDEDDRVQCPNCDEWVDEDDIAEYNIKGETVKLCGSCWHNAHRSGAFD